MLKKLPLYRKVLPWAAAAGILAYLFYRVDHVLFLESLLKANLVLYIPLIVVFVMVWFLIETWNIQMLYHYFGHEIAYGEMLKVKGASFLLMIINYGLGAGGIALYMKKIKSIPVFRSMGMFFYYMVLESGAIAFLAAMGCLLTGESSPVLDKVLWISLGLFYWYNSEIVVIRFIPPWKFLGRLLEKPFFKVIRSSTPRSYFGLFLGRSIYFLSFIVFFYFAVRAFHIDIPFLTLVALVPIIFFVGNLPITPFGLGTIQAAMIFFFKSYSSEPNVFALSIVYSTGLLFLRALIGLFYLSRVASIQLISDEVDDEDETQVCAVN